MQFLVSKIFQVKLVKTLRPNRLSFNRNLYFQIYKRLFEIIDRSERSKLVKIVQTSTTFSLKIYSAPNL